jgi:hypothetical protein
MRPLTEPAIARSLPSAPPWGASGPLGIAALAAAVWALRSYVELLKVPSASALVVCLPLAYLVGFAWLGVNIRAAAILGALAGAWAGLLVGFVYLIALGEAGPPPMTLFVSVLILTVAFGAVIGSVVVTLTTWGLRTLMRWLNPSAADAAPRLWTYAVVVAVGGIPPVLVALHITSLVANAGLLLLGVGGVITWALWRDLCHDWRWLAAAPLVTLVLLFSWYWLVELSYPSVRWQLFDGWAPPLWAQALNQSPDVYIERELRARYALHGFPDLLLISGLHSGPLAALVWGWLAWLGYTRARAG